MSRIIPTLGGSNWQELELEIEGLKERNGSYDDAWMSIYTKMGYANSLYDNIAGGDEWLVAQRQHS
jgi:hypothetical protein